MMASSLPPELIQKIAEYLIDDNISLFNAALVNTLWARVFIDVLWRQISERAFSFLGSDKLTRRQFYADKIHRLVLSDGVVHNHFRVISQLKFPKLSYLKVSSCHDWKTIEYLILETLTSLAFEAHPKSRIDTPFGLLRTITQRCHNIRYLRLNLLQYSCPAQEFLVLFQACKKLETIELCGSADNPDDYSEDFDFLHHLLFRQEHLRHLRIYDYWLTATTAQRLLEELSGALPKSSFLAEQSDTQELCPSAHIAAKLESLEICLSFVGFEGGGPDAGAAIYALLAQLQHLKSLSVQFSASTPSSISGILAIRQLQSLEQLLVWGNAGLPSLGTREEQISFCSAFPQMRVFDLNFSGEFDSAALIALGRTSRHLNELTILLGGRSDGVDLHMLDQVEDVLFPELQDYNVAVQKPHDPESENEAKLMARLIHRHMPRVDDVACWYSFASFRNRFEQEWIALRAKTTQPRLHLNGGNNADARWRGHPWFVDDDDDGL
ncbi:hypothetical protein K461DRAFT_281867 [Myriangium duriaei CBS 260.36]|uniref:F-box domain-containing protein n=1 Tax=Myriangium duriaei CBS 260.36 TaxID=1168546 RepID=A0A9P4MH00_9PEZI|nr:hypothetical protein K461DRAFT_281867 [Myriangium duriaei CBS 260.36]